MIRFLVVITACCLTFVACLPLTAMAEPAPDRPVILISIDGFRADYIDRGVTPNLSKLAAQGLHGALRPSFPTKTFPNHYALVTGKRPDNSGIVGNDMIDPRRPTTPFSLQNPRQAKDPFWWEEAEPIWVTAEKAGLRTATMFWPGSDVAIHGQRPTDWFQFSSDVTNDQRVRTVTDWLRRPAESRPQFISLYFDTIDTVGHRYGPDSAEINTAIAEIDTVIGNLINSFDGLGVRPYLFIVADHGMRAVASDQVIQLADLIDLASIVPVVTGAYAAIEPVAGTDNRVLDALLGKHDHMECWDREHIPERLHYGKNDRVAAITCLPEAGWSILTGPPEYPVAGGTHGFDNEDEQMLAVFIATGLGHKGQIETVDNIEIYPLLASLLGVTALESDATGKMLAYSPKGN